MKVKKEPNLIIQFDDKEYSKEEIKFLWERFFLLLLESQNTKIDPKIIKNSIKSMVSEVFTPPKEIRIPSNTDKQRD